VIVDGAHNRFEYEFFGEAGGEYAAGLLALLRVGRTALRAGDMRRRWPLDLLALGWCAEGASG
jgi:hypothetical protein